LIIDKREKEVNSSQELSSSSTEKAMDNFGSCYFGYGKVRAIKTEKIENWL
jgi:anti-sigma28 factor (negative regulator of flagellin synthesis)